MALAVLALTVTGSLAAHAPQTEEAAVRSIRRHYAAVNKGAARYKRVKKELTGFSVEGGQMVAYFDGDRLMKVVANHYGESGRAVEEYYFRDGRLIFVYRKDSNYDRPMSGKVVYTAEHRLYFDGDRLIRWVGPNGKQVAHGATEYEEKQKEYLESAKLLADGARSTKASVEAPN